MLEFKYEESTSTFTLLDVNPRRREGDRLILNGKANFMSLAGLADYVFVEAKLSDKETSLCFVPTKSKGFEIGRYHFNDSMLLTATAEINFTDCTIDKNNYACSKAHNINTFVKKYQRIWFHALVSYCYACGINHLVETILRNIDGKDKESLPGNNIIFGKLVVELDTIKQLLAVIIEKLNQTKWNDNAIDEIFNLSISCKHLVSECADKINEVIYHFLGARVFLQDDINKKISELRYIKVQPMSNIDIMHHFSKNAMICK